MFRESTFIAILSFQPSSSTFCQGVSVAGRRKRTETPATKHCQAGVGQRWDQVWGERRGEEGAGEDEDTPLSPPAPDSAGTIPYSGRGAERLTATLAACEAGRSSRDELEEEWYDEGAGERRLEGGKGRGECGRWEKAGKGIPMALRAEGELHG